MLLYLYRLPFGFYFLRFLKLPRLCREDECEMFDVGDYTIEHCYEENGKIHILYSLDYILQTFPDSEFVWRIQGTIKFTSAYRTKKRLLGRSLLTAKKALTSSTKSTNLLYASIKIYYYFIEADIIE